MKMKNWLCFNDQPVYTAQWNLKTRSICSWLSVSTSALNAYFLFGDHRDMEMESSLLRFKEMNFDSLIFGASVLSDKESMDSAVYIFREFHKFVWLFFRYRTFYIIFAKFRLFENTFNDSVSNYNWFFCIILRMFM